MFASALRRLLWFLPLVLVLAGPSRQALGQSQAIGAAIGGVVTDPSGAVIPGVSIDVVNTATNWARTVITDSSGRYSVLGIQVGIRLVCPRSIH